MDAIAPLSTHSLRGPLRKRESHLWSREVRDWYVEPQWVSQRLFEAEPFDGHILDPAAGSGRIIEAAAAAGYQIFASDIVSRAPFVREADWLSASWADQFGMVPAPRNIVSNPPFGICDRAKDRPVGFVDLCLERASGKIALLLPANWVQGDKRSRWLETTPLYKVLFISPRPSMPPGAVIEAGGKPGNGTTDYAWLIWLKGFKDAPTIGWLRRDS